MTVVAALHRIDLIPWDDYPFRVFLVPVREDAVRRDRFHDKLMLTLHGLVIRKRNPPRLDNLQPCVAEAVALEVPELAVY